LSRLPPFDKESGALNIVVETPKNAGVKYKYNEKYGIFQFDETLPYGFSLPFEFGFVPSTIGGDGDLWMWWFHPTKPTFPGCLVLGEVLGVLQAEQREVKQVNRNDRLVAIPLSAKNLEPMIPTKSFSSFFTTKHKARNSYPGALAAVNVPWTWSKRHANERAKTVGNPTIDLL
jgi:inorganic pyrophosphatase